jgi:hypothetical protein
MVANELGNVTASAQGNCGIVATRKIHQDWLHAGVQLPVMTGRSTSSNDRDFSLHYFVQNGEHFVQAIKIHTVCISLYINLIFAICWLFSAVVIIEDLRMYVY